MGRAAKIKKGDGDQTLSLFDAAQLPARSAPPTPRFGRLEAALWTDSKARLIENYLYRFGWVTRHGAYIDGFAAPQARDHADVKAAVQACSASRVLNIRPPFLRDFWLCDLDSRGITLLRDIRDASPREKGRRVDVLHGDFNILVDQILDSGRITDQTATFALLDQRTFECHWKTVRKLARHKQNGMKIELFYFLGSSWLERAMVGTTRNKQKIDRWWGRKDWLNLLNLSRGERAELFRNRFLEELGYAHAFVWPIYERGNADSNAVYHMIHCTDHDIASDLMHKAYQTITRPGSPEQIELFPGQHFADSL
jgi:three-Cys-motif partner protein